MSNTKRWPINNVTFYMGRWAGSQTQQQTFPRTKEMVTGEPVMVEAEYYGSASQDNKVTYKDIHNTPLKDVKDEH